MIEQTPTPTILAVVPETVHTAGVVEANVTGNAELATAFSVSGPEPYNTLDGTLPPSVIRRIR